MLGYKVRFIEMALYCSLSQFDDASVAPVTTYASCACCELNI